MPRRTLSAGTRARAALSLATIAVLLSCDVSDVFDPNQNPLVLPQVMVTTPDGLTAGDTARVAVSAFAVLHLTRLEVNVRGAIVRDTVLAIEAQQQTSLQLKLALPVTLPDSMLYVTATATDIHGQVSKPRADTTRIGKKNDPPPQSDNTPPSAAVTINPTSALAGSTVAIRVVAQDNVALQKVGYAVVNATNDTIGGRPVLAATSGTSKDTTFSFVIPSATAAGTLRVYGIAMDAAGARTLSSVANLTVTTPAPPPPPPPPPPTGTTLELTVTRFDNVTTETLSTSGVPMKPGLLRPENLGQVRLEINGQEVPIYVEQLGRVHKDGSVRSLLLQFRYSGASGGRATLRFGMTRTLNIARTNVAYTYASPLPAAVALPASAEYLMSTELIGPTVLPSQSFHAGYEQAWVNQSNTRFNWFRSVYGGSLTVDQAILANYYDRAMFHWAAWVRTGDVEHWKRASYYLIAFRARYMTPNNYHTQPHNWQVEGLTMHYLLTSDPENLNGLRRHAELAATVWLGHLGDNANPYNEGRIQERVVQAFLGARTAGLTDRDYPTLLRTTLNKILASQKADGSYPSANWCNGQSNYMTGLVNDIMIRYYETFEEDARITPSIKKSVDWMWSTQWKAAEGGFSYVSVYCSGIGDTSPSPDLNMLIVNGFGWVYKQTRDTNYRTRGDIVFNEGVNRAWLPNDPASGDKQFNQQYRSSFRYLNYRQ